MLGVASAAGRVAGTVIGVVLAGLLFVAWPTWSSGPARQALARLMDAQRAYVHAVLDSLVEGVPPREDDLRRLGRRVRLAWTKAASTVARSLAEPAPRRIDAHQSQGLLTALREIYAWLESGDGSGGGPPDELLLVQLDEMVAATNTAAGLPRAAERQLVVVASLERSRSGATRTTSQARPSRCIVRISHPDGSSSYQRRPWKAERGKA
jgi:hypothetical protein